MILSGEEVAATIRNSLKAEISALAKKRPPKLSVILVGKNEASKVYVGMKERACSAVGIISEKHLFTNDIQEKELLAFIEKLNCDNSVDGILVQLPLPKQISTERVFATISPTKDIDGFHPLNMGKLLLGHSDGFVPCTPLGIQKLLEGATEGKDVVIVGRSNLVGKPLAALLVQKGVDATVTLVHSKSKDVRSHTKRADILVAAVGVPEFIKGDMVKEGATVIDVGIHRNEEGRLMGDVAFEEVAKKASLITPVPGGVGPMTVAMLLYNTVKSYKCALS